MYSRFAAVLVAAAVTVAAGCGADRAQAGVTQVTGVIQRLDRGADGRVNGMAVKDARGKVRRIVVDPKVDYGFDLDHLEKHQTDGLPVRVPVHESHGQLVADAINDVLR